MYSKVFASVRVPLELFYENGFLFSKFSFIIWMEFPAIKFTVYTFRDIPSYRAVAVSSLPTVVE